MKLSNRNNINKNDLILYAITDRNWLNGKKLVEECETAIKSGVTFLQLREKKLEYEEFKNEALEIKKICEKYKVPFVINDNVDLAKEIDADGVHVGQSDMKAKDVRSIIGDEKILGVSAKNVEQAVEAENNGADYIGVGAVFKTSTKEDAEEVPIDVLKEICEKVSIPVVAIGGITIENIKELKNTGICGVAVISAIFAAEDISDATKNLYNEAIRITR